MHVPQAPRSMLSQVSRSLYHQLAMQIDNAVPPCSLHCVKTFVSSNYPAAVCQDHESILCPCTKGSSSGFTLGEAALRCLLSSCSDLSEADFQVYSLCSGIHDALPNTRSTLTVTVQTAPTFIRSPSRPLRTSTMSSFHTPLTSPDSTTASSPAQSKSSDLTTDGTKSINPSSIRDWSEPGTPWPTAAQGTVPPSTTSIPTSKPSRNQVIGMSAAGAAVGAILIALIVYFLVRRRQSPLRQKNQDDGFEIGGPMSEPPKQELLLPAVNHHHPPQTPVGSYNQPIIQHLPRMPTVREHEARALSPNAQRDGYSTERMLIGLPASAINSATANPASRPPSDETGSVEYSGKRTIRGVLRKGRKGSRIARSKKGKEPWHTQAWGSAETRSIPNASRSDSDVQDDVLGISSASGRPGGPFPVTNGGTGVESKTMPEQSTSPSRSLLHTMPSTPTQTLSPYQVSAGSGAPLTQVSSNGFNFGHANQVKYYVNRPTSREQKYQSQLERDNSRRSTSSVTTIDTLDSSEIDVVTKVPQRVSTKLSPVKESTSPGLRPHPGHQQAPGPTVKARAPGLPRAVDHHLLDCPRQSPVYELPRPKRHSRTDSLLAKRRGTSFANSLKTDTRVTSSKPSLFTVSSSEYESVDGGGQARNVQQSQSTSPFPGREELPEEGGTRRGFEKRRNEDLGSPRKLKVTPTRDGSKLVLQFE